MSISKTQFDNELRSYKKLIDRDIEDYCKSLEMRTKARYGEPSAMVEQAYTDLLKRGGKRIRGTLTMIGYEMCGGKDRKLALEAARAIEMMHAHMLVLDDIQDRSESRRGRPSAHKSLEAKHNEMKWRGDAAHSGVALAINAALLGSHNAQMILANMEVDSELRTKALMIMSHTMVVTAHGQTHDIINEVGPRPSYQDIENVMQWKSGHYSILNPIHMGMVIAGADCEDTNAITGYAINIGKAFQITDDLLIVTGIEKTGKNPMDDIREGKQTLLTVYALENSAPSDVRHLEKCLGNLDLKQEDFRRCQKIFLSSGAVRNAQKIAEGYVAAALESLHRHAERWPDKSVGFLDRLAHYLVNRAH